MSGDGHPKVRQARTAAAIVAKSIHHLKLTELERFVCRSPRTLEWSRKQAQRKAGKHFWNKIAAIRREVETP